MGLEPIVRQCLAECVRACVRESWKEKGKIINLQKSWANKIFERRQQQQQQQSHYHTFALILFFSPLHFAPLQLLARPPASPSLSPGKLEAPASIYAAASPIVCSPLSQQPEPPPTGRRSFGPVRANEIIPRRPLGWQQVARPLWAGTTHLATVVRSVRLGHKSVRLVWPLCAASKGHARPADWPPLQRELAAARPEAAQGHR